LLPPFADFTGIKKIKIEGNPDFDHVSASYVERQNLNHADAYASLYAPDQR
jgi:hypothetical protein